MIVDMDVVKVRTSQTFNKGLCTLTSMFQRTHSLVWQAWDDKQYFGRLS
jgi:hypothetical protein